MKNGAADRKSTRLNSSHVRISYAVFCLKKKNKIAEPHSVVIETATSEGTIDSCNGEWFRYSGLTPESTPGTGWSQALHLFFNDPATTEIYTLSLHDALPI